MLYAKLLQHAALGFNGRTSKQIRKRRTEIDVTNRPLYDIRAIDGRSERHHPCVAC